MDPLLALGLAEQAFKMADALFNAYLEARSTIEAGDVKVQAARVAALKESSDALSAKLHLELHAIIAKG